MGDQQRTAARDLNGRVATAFWSLLLIGSAIAIGAGFVGGRRLAGPGFAVSPAGFARGAAPAPERERYLERSLHGSGSFDQADDDTDPYGDVNDAVSAPPAGWPAAIAQGERPRIAIVLVGGDREASAMAAFAAEPFPLAIVLPPDADSDDVRRYGAAGMTVLADCSGAGLDALAALRRAGTAGIACSTANARRARVLAAAAEGGIVFDDRLAEDDVLFRVARLAHHRAVARDVLADAADVPAYDDFLFDQAISIARRRGTAVVAVHARPSSRSPLERFAAHALRDDIDIVPLNQVST
jgi:hypothetical protein